MSRYKPNAGPGTGVGFKTSVPLRPSGGRGRFGTALRTDGACRPGGLVGGEALTGRAVLVDAPLGKGHVVMFATRPYWRWQTHGLFFLGFNALLNWNDLDKK